MKKVLKSSARAEPKRIFFRHIPCPPGESHLDSGSLDPQQGLIPLILFFARLERIGETVEIRCTKTNVLDTLINTGHYRYL